MYEQITQSIGSSIKAALMIVAVGLAGASPASSQTHLPTLAPMPPELETRFALSALPPRLRADASVYLLDPKSGYRLARKGTSSLNCLVQRTAWELSDFRDDIYYPLCFDREGSRTYLKVIIDSARLRAQGITPAALTKRVTKGYTNKTYRVPTKAGLSYMVGPVMRTVDPGRTVRTMAMPHLMFYAPGVSNEDVGAKPDLSDFSTLMNPFIDEQGNSEQRFLIQIVGETERAKILNDEKQLAQDLCNFRKILCVEPQH